MPEKILAFIDKKANWMAVMRSFLSSLILACCMLSQCFGLIKLNPDAVMDPLNFYRADLFFHHLNIQGQTGRQAYLIFHLIDYVFISQFYPMFTYLIQLFLRRLRITGLLRFTVFLPILSALMDLFENMSIDISIVLYPSKIMFIGDLAGFFTAIKITSIDITIIFALLLFLFFIIKKFQGRLLNNNESNDL